MRQITTGVEILTADGGRACVDREGWHSGEPMTLAQLEQRCALSKTGDDPVLDAAHRAIAEFGGRILVIRRHAALRESMAAAPSRLYRALTDSTLHRALFGSEENDFDANGFTDRDLRILAISLLLIASGLGAIFGGWLAHRADPPPAVATSQPAAAAAK